MLYTDRDLATEERNAWQRGDYAAAELLALAIDLEPDALRADELQSKLDNIRERITEANWRTGKKAELRELVEQIIAELAAA